VGGVDLVHTVHVLIDGCTAADRVVLGRSAPGLGRETVGAVRGARQVTPGLGGPLVVARRRGRTTTDDGGAAGTDLDVAVAGADADTHRHGLGLGGTSGSQHGNQGQQHQGGLGHGILHHSRQKLPPRFTCISSYANAQ